MSSNNQRSSRRAAATGAPGRQTRQVTAADETTATRRNGRACVRSVANDKKTYFVDSDDDMEETKPSPSKRTKSNNVNGV